MLTLLFAMSAFYGTSFALGEIEFSSVVVEKLDGAAETGKMYVASKMSRFELEGSDEIIVTRYDRGVMWIVFPKLKLYVEEPCVGEGFSGSQVKKGTGSLSREFLGYEEVDSYRQKKFLITVEYDGKKEQKDQYYEWYRDNFPFPVKTSSLNDSFSYEYTKIKIGRQNPELFAFPKNYKKVTIEEVDAIKASKKR